MVMPRLGRAHKFRSPEEEQQIQQELDICYKTVHTFGGIVGRKLYLKSKPGVPSSTFNVITVPFNDPEVYLRVARQLSHILFGTDPDARDAFLFAYTKRASEYARKAHINIDDALLAQKLRTLVNILEVYRVTSLWGLLYPGNYLHLRLLDIVDAEKLLSRGEDENLLGYFLLLSLGVDEIKVEHLERFRPYFVEAMKKVERRGFDATLLIAKWLITKLVNELIRESKGEDPPDSQGMSPNEAEEFLSMMLGLGGDEDPDKDGDENQEKEEGEGGGGTGDPGDQESPEGDSEGEDEENGESGESEPSEEDEKEPEESPESPEEDPEEQKPWEPPPVSANLQTRAQALSDLLDRLGELPQRAEQSMNSVQSDEYTPDWKKAKSRGLAGSITNANINKGDLVERALARSQKDTEHLVDKALVSLAKTPIVERDEWLKKDARAKVDFVDIPKSTMVVPLAPEDRTAVKRLRATFMRVLGRRKFSLRDTGTEADVQAHIQRRVSKTPIDCFSHEERGMGFEAIVLVDLSSSMMGDKAEQVERAARIITRALRFPFCDVRVWGFSSPSGGTVNLFRYNRLETDPSVRAFVKGSTPLHIALRLAVRQLQDSSQDRHLIVLTDGMPYFQSWKGRSYSTDQLKRYVAQTVSKARSRGVHVTTVFVGSYLGWGQRRELRYDLTPEDMRKMFGPSKLWKRVSPESLGRDLIKLVSNSFISYLVRR